MSLTIEHGIGMKPEQFSYDGSNPTLLEPFKTNIEYALSQKGIPLPTRGQLDYGHYPMAKCARAGSSLVPITQENLDEDGGFKSLLHLVLTGRGNAGEGAAVEGVDGGEHLEPSLVVTEPPRQLVEALVGLGA